MIILYPAVRGQIRHLHCKRDLDVTAQPTGQPSENALQFPPLCVVLQCPQSKQSLGDGPPSARKLEGGSSVHACFDESAWPHAVSLGIPDEERSQHEARQKTHSSVSPKATHDSVKAIPVGINE